MAIRTEVVNSGDTLSKIAKRNNMSLDTLLKINADIKNPDLIFVGQTINVEVEDVDLGVKEEIAADDISTTDPLSTSFIEPTVTNEAEDIVFSDSAPTVEVEEVDLSTPGPAVEAQEVEVSTPTPTVEVQEVELSAAEPVVEVQETPSAVIEPTNSVYSSNPDIGFQITSDNQTYNLSEDDKQLMIAVVAAEAAPNADDALAVASSILNRCEDGPYVRDNGTNPIDQIKADRQYAVYTKGIYKKYMINDANYDPKNAIKVEIATMAVNDALGGVRNNNYINFSRGGKGYKIVSNGNSYSGQKRPL